MGDCNEPTLFMINYYRSVNQYIASTDRLVSSKLTIEHPFESDVRIDLSIYTFVDDILRLIPLDDDIDALLVSNADSVGLTRSLAMKSYLQNDDKIAGNSRSETI